VSNALNNIINGLAGNDTISGNGGYDTLIGGAGNDQLIGGAGNDILNGGDGVDTADYSSSHNAVNVTLDSGQLNFDNPSSLSFNDGFGGKDRLYNIENLTGSNYNDTLNGEVSNALNNIINGLAGNDTISGNGGNDTLIGGAGNDQLIGGTGADILNGGDGSDTADYSTSTNKVIVTLNNGHWTGDPNDPINSTFNDGFGSKDKLYNFENLTGSNHDDGLYGEWYAWNNIINGLAGNDTISGNGGNDTLIGGAGNDQLVGGTGDDIIDGGDGSDTAVINGFRWQIELNWKLGDSGKFTLKDNVSNRDGIDSLIDVERLQFKEVSVALFNNQNNLWFNPVSYLSKNDDLIRAFGPNNYSAAATHYIRDGYRENRLGVFG
jgi:Ca2+-binding RTX toxin-like protein